MLFHVQRKAGDASTSSAESPFPSYITAHQICCLSANVNKKGGIKFPELIKYYFMIQTLKKKRYSKYFFEAPPDQCEAFPRSSFIPFYSP